MFTKEWPILIVDDDPDVLAISALALRNVTVDGASLKIHRASSMAEAITLLDSQLASQYGTTLAVALIDVVMETDDAGLQLCDYIRSTLKNRTTQLYIRTGQPGVAPERTVIDRHDINGYFSKAETTEDKLYSLVKAGVRQYAFTRDALSLLRLVGLVAHADSLAGIGQTITRSLEHILVRPEGSPRTDEVQLSCAIFLADQLISHLGMSPDEARATRSRLATEAGSGLESVPGKAVIDGSTLLVQLDASPSREAADLVINMLAPPSDTYVSLLASFLDTVATLGRRASAREVVGAR